MSERTWQVDVEISAVVRHKVSFPVDAENKTMAEAIAAAQIRQGAPDLTPPYTQLRWMVHRAEAREVGS